ncbi:hypothetical protein OL383_004418 [Salmonella enterica]|nr:hypothetical protein [Salmonella enterica]
MNKYLIALVLACASVSAQATDAHSFVYMCGKTVVTVDRNGPDGYATWQDHYGYHTNLPVYFVGTVPDDQGLLQTNVIFAKEDDSGAIKGAGLFMIYTKKINKMEYRFTNTAFDSGQEQGRNVFEQGTCKLTDSN